MYKALADDLLLYLFFFIIHKSEIRKMAQISYGVSIEKLLINCSFAKSDFSTTKRKKDDGNKTKD